MKTSDQSLDQPFLRQTLATAPWHVLDAPRHPRSRQTTARHTQTPATLASARIEARL